MKKSQYAVFLSWNEYNTIRQTFFAFLLFSLRKYVMCRYFRLNDMVSFSDFV